MSLSKPPAWLAKELNRRSHMAPAGAMARRGPEPELLQKREVKAIPARGTKKN
jgi:hypothetical protein